VPFSILLWYLGALCVTQDKSCSCGSQRQLGQIEYPDSQNILGGRSTIHFSQSQRARTLHVRHRQLRLVYGMLAFQAFSTSPQAALDVLHAKLNATAPCPDRATYPDMPSVIHTTRALTFRGMHDEISGDYSSQNTIFHELLGLPLLDPDNSLAFCSHKFETFLLLKRIASGPSTLLQQAGVLEDIFIW
jgi:hypothetical protein